MSTNDAFVVLIRRLHDRIQRAQQKGRHALAEKLEQRRLAAVGLLLWRRRRGQQAEEAGRRQYDVESRMASDHY